MGPHRDRLRVVAAVLLVAAAVLLVVGTSLERSQAASETRQAAGVGRSRGEAGDHNQTAEQAGSSHNEAAEHAASGEELFGIELEGVQLTVAAAVVSLLLAGLLVTVAGQVGAAGRGDLRAAVRRAGSARERAPGQRGTRWPAGNRAAGRRGPPWRRGACRRQAADTTPHGRGSLGVDQSEAVLIRRSLEQPTTEPARDRSGDS